MDSLGFALLGIAGFGPAFKVAVEGDRVYASAGATVMCFDTSLELLGYYHAISDIWGLEARGDTVFVAAGSQGLLILDFSQPGTPRLLSETPTGAHANNLLLSGDTLYLCQHQTLTAGALVAFDVSNPESPESLGAYRSDNIFQAGAGCASRGDTLFLALASVAGNNGSLKILDVSDPSSISELGSWDEPQNAQDVKVSGNIAYIADGPGGLLIADVSDPTNVVLLGRFQRQNSFGLARAMEVELLGADTVLLADGFVVQLSQPNANLILLDCSEPSSPQVLAGLNTDDFAWGLALAGSVAFVSDEWGGVIKVWVGDTLVRLGQRLTGSYGLEVDYEAGYAYEAAEGGGLRVHLVGDSVAEVGGTRCYSFVHDVDYCGGYAYIAAQWGGVGVVEVSQPENPAQLSYYTPDTGNLFLACMDVAYDPRGFVYSAWGDTGLIVVDVSQPESPFEVARLRPWGGARVKHLHLSGQTLFLSTDSGIVAVDVAQPNQPVELGRLRADSLEKLWADGETVYAAAGYLGLLIADFSNPQVPESLGVYPVGPFEFLYDVCVQGQTAFVSYGKRFGESMPSAKRGVAALDVSDPSQPREVGHFFNPVVFYGLYASGDTVFCARETGDVFVLLFRGQSVHEEKGEPCLKARFSGEFLLVALPREGLELSLYSASGRLLGRWNLKGKSGKIRVGRLKRGVYYLKVPEIGECAVLVKAS